jgi:hypothetical protein
MTEVEEDVSHDARMLMLSIKGLDSYRHHTQGRDYLKEMASDLELSRDRLSRMIDDLRGVK